MRCLLRSEFYKLKKSLGFRLLLLGNLVCIILMFLLYVKVLDSPLTGYHVMKSSLGLVLYHTYIGYLFGAVFICREFSNRTFPMGFLCGYSRNQIFLAKTLTFYLGFLVLFCQFTGLETLFFSMSNGFGLEWGLETIKNVLGLWACGLAGCFATGAIIICLSVISKKGVVTLGIGVGMTYLLLWLETTFRDHPLPFIKYTFCYQIRQFQFERETFSPSLFLAIVLGTCVSSLLAAFVIFEKTELQ